MPKKSNRVRRLGERVLVAEGQGMWQAGKVSTIIELQDGGVAYVVTLKKRQSGLGTGKRRQS